MFLCRRQFYSDLRRLKKNGGQWIFGGASNFSNLLAPWASGSRSLMLRAAINNACTCRLCGERQPTKFHLLSCRTSSLASYIVITPVNAGYFLGIIRYGPMGPCHWNLMGPFCNEWVNFFSIVNAYMMQQNNSRSTLVLIVPLLIKYIFYISNWNKPHFILPKICII